MAVGRAPSVSLPNGLANFALDTTSPRSFIFFASRIEYAAQASRDRKKEHTVYLEQRVAQLEAQLAVPLPFVPPPSHGGSSTPRSNTSNLPSTRSSRSHSISSSTTSVSDHPSSHGAASSAASSTSAAPSASKIAKLEQEKENLRARLHAEQMETSRLRERLESLEDKFKRFEHFLAAPLSTSAPDPITSHPSPTNAADFPIVPTTTTAPALGPACSLNNVCGDDSMTIRSDFDDPMSPDGTSYSTLPSSVRSSSRKSTPSSSAHSSPISTRRSMLPNLTTNSDSSRLVAREVEISLPRKLSERVLFINLECSALSPTLWI
ncbi:BQ2448_6337 [Microbotryum intermedium]|uniref:BQ2448_6337 protein n=1 Tax=Microbotryum intermedium TaxID=269621 RepID=A0A238FKY5_9BASI|nr:BQ2448_6337 [Microbotryum intermedium]